MGAPGNAGTIYRGGEGVNSPRSVGQTYLPLGKSESLGKAARWTFQGKPRITCPKTFLLDPKLLKL